MGMRGCRKSSGCGKNVVVYNIERSSPSLEWPTPSIAQNFSRNTPKINGQAPSKAVSVQLPSVYTAMILSSGYFWPKQGKMQWNIVRSRLPHRPRPRAQTVYILEERCPYVCASPQKLQFLFISLRHHKPQRIPSQEMCRGPTLPNRPCFSLIVSSYISREWNRHAISYRWPQFFIQSRRWLPCGFV